MPEKLAINGKSVKSWENLRKNKSYNNIEIKGKRDYYDERGYRRDNPKIFQHRTLCKRRRNRGELLYRQQKADGNDNRGGQDGIQDRGRDIRKGR